MRRGQVRNEEQGGSQTCGTMGSAEAARGCGWIRKCGSQGWAELPKARRRRECQPGCRGPRQPRVGPRGGPAFEARWIPARRRWDKRPSVAARPEARRRPGCSRQEVVGVLVVGAVGCVGNWRTQRTKYGAASSRTKCAWSKNSPNCCNDDSSSRMSHLARLRGNARANRRANAKSCSSWRLRLAGSMPPSAQLPYRANRWGPSANPG